MPSCDIKFELYFPIVLLTGLGNQHFSSAYGYRNLLIVLITFVLKTLIMNLSQKITQAMA